MQAILDE